MADFLPAKDDALLAWSNNFNTYISGLADPAVIGITAQMVTDYGVLATAFAGAMTAVTASNSSANVQTKNTARTALIAGARTTVRMVQAFTGTTDTQRIEMQITVPDSEPTPRPVPAFAPVLSVVSVTGHTIKLRLRDAENPDRRGKADGAAGACIWSYVGEAAPGNIYDWKPQGSITRTIFDIALSSSVPAGSRVWLTAQWFNARQENGPASEPISTTIAGGVSLAA